MSETNKERNLRIDRPASEDSFGIENHITGIAKYITSCYTPMTLSIQGEWGSGKSSIMSMVKKSIEEEEEKSTTPKVLNVWIDTWQFSQFSLGKELPLILLDRLSVGIEKQYSELIKKEAKKSISSPMVIFLHRFIHLFQHVAKDVIINKIGVDIDKINNEIKENKKGISELYEMINELKEKFRKFIDEKKEVDRIIIYIDDLDRLTPSKAVELLEVLKIFLDVEKCVFVLAIDYDIVIRGVTDRYGYKLENETDRNKARSFFDKIIQVVFSIPTSKYDFSNYIGDSLLSDIKKTLSDAEYTEVINKYMEALEYSIGYNPRAIKKIINSFELIKHTENGQVNQTLHMKNLNARSFFTFTQLCLQHAFPDTFSKIESSFAEILENYLDSFSLNNDDSQSIDKLKEQLMEDVSKKLKLNLNNAEESNEHKITELIVYNIIRDHEDAMDIYNTLRKIRLTSTNTSPLKSSYNTYFLGIKELFDDVSFSHKQRGYLLDDLLKVNENICKLNDKISTTYKSRSYQWLIAYNYEDAAIAEIYLNVNSFTIELKLGKVKDNEGIQEIAEKHNKSISKNNNLSLKLYDNNQLIQETLDDALEVLKLILENKEQH